MSQFSLFFIYLCFKSNNFFQSIDRWNEWLLFPLKLSDIPRDALLSLTIVDTSDSGKPYVLGGTAITVFGKHEAMRRGMYDLRVWINDQNDSDNTVFQNGKYCISSQISRITKVFKVWFCLTFVLTNPFIVSVEEKVQKRRAPEEGLVGQTYVPRDRKNNSNRKEKH